MVAPSTLLAKVAASLPGCTLLMVTRAEDDSTGLGFSSEATFETPVLKGLCHCFLAWVHLMARSVIPRALRHNGRTNTNANTKIHSCK